MTFIFPVDFIIHWAVNLNVSVIFFCMMKLFLVALYIRKVGLSSHNCRLSYLWTDEIYICIW